MKSHLVYSLAVLVMTVTIILQPARAEVVRPAPDFLFQSAGGRQSTLKSLRGQPVVVLVAPGPRSGIFRKQVRYLEELYRKFASRNVVFMAVFTQEPGARADSDIPFLYPTDPLAAASSLGTGSDYMMVVIGRDGNMDMVTRKLHAAAYVESVINNSYVVQNKVRK